MMMKLKRYKCVIYFVLQTMYNNIVLSGGTTMMSGFADRIYNDLGTQLENKDSELYRNAQIIAEGNRNIAPWIGASMVSSMSSFAQTFITKEDYGDAGESKFPNMFQKIF